jgi:hypothetical protein
MTISLMGGKHRMSDTNDRKPLEQPVAELTQDEKIERALNTLLVKRADISNPEWIRVNGDRYIQACRDNNIRWLD